MESAPLAEADQDQEAGAAAWDLSRASGETVDEA